MKYYTKLILSAILLIVTSISLKAQTNVSGGIYSNTTWTKANSPYIVTDTVVVFPGFTLTIEAGVTVKFADATQLELRQANLITSGTISDSITFTSNSNNPQPGIWSGIYLNSDPDTIEFNYCNFRYCSTAVQGDCYFLTIKNSIFSYNLKGINGNINLVDSCVFTNNNNGMYINNASINHSSFSNNQTAIFGLYNSYLMNCIITSNQIGVETYLPQAEGHIENCIIDSNNIGIEVNPSSDGHLDIKNCTINYNDSAGFIGGDDASGDSIYNCQIKYNGYGIEATTYTICNKNDIENNNVGVIDNYVLYPSYFSCNKICNNTTYNFKNTGNEPIYIPNNYWCSTDSATIEALIYDGYDNISLGIVYFLPLDTIGCYLTGCDLHLSANVTNATCDTCHNGQATINIANGHPNYTYTWFTSPIQTTQTATGLASGTYSVCVSDGDGCTACTTVFVDSSNCIGFAVVANGANATCLLCNDGKAWVDVTNGTAPYSYTWYTIPIQNTDTAYNLLHGSYSVCVTDLYGCAACDSVTIGTGACSAHFDLYPDTSILHTYIAVNMASGVGTLTYDWNWGDGSADDHTPFPSHTYATAGFYKICLTITDTAGCTDTYCNSFYLLRTTNTMIYVMVIPPVSTGVKENSDNASFAVFPNPVSDNLTLIIPDNASKATIKIFNLLGELMSSLIIAKQKADIDVSLLASGIYIIEVSDRDSIMRQKFIKE